ncbi:fumarylacetoacetate (FAA) hydrolase [Haloterrigena salina JCM 13891]|uniref:Fumarylacetoacetate (FAA) hydrolase n=1 Tax=Haloterrigena salina JCM 13891 TaxID=1227488 RepID=M0BYG4_9EURY|nr:fumarylacetoacetate hydrolase family protein [Haloterrigena salina]ELZ15453.1 fumarylacetoacetate (FAA) hydrolase [Haloterrigena salina JCM 13891]
MRYHRLPDGDGYRLIADDGDAAYDLTAVKPRLDEFTELAAAANVADTDVDELAETLVETAPTVDREALADSALPIVPDEVWAAGVTYEISEEAREAESGMPEMYVQVYEAERPEIFFKATPSRTVGPDEPVGIRADSAWDVPEPELGIVLYDGEIVGYTIGNDMSSRSIEGENPLYLPQAKVYDKCCSIGPCIASAESVGDPHELTMTMEISRDGETLYEGETSTGEMDRSCEELVEYWCDHNSVPQNGVLLTGTSLVPDDGFTLRPDDEVRIEIDRIGELVNTVVEV